MVRAEHGIGTGRVWRAWRTEMRPSFSLLTALRVFLSFSAVFTKADSTLLFRLLLDLSKSQLCRIIRGLGYKLHSKCTKCISTERERESTQSRG
jgi:hypothetical protein